MSILDQLTKLSSTVQPVTVQDETFYIRVMSGFERDAWEQYVSDPTDKNSRAKLYAQLLVKTLADASGNRAFSDDDVDTIASKNSKALKELFDEAYAINKMGDEGVAEAKKESAAVTTSDSGSSLPANSE